jgi:hypothetical protein
MNRSATLEPLALLALLAVAAPALAAAPAPPVPPAAAASPLEPRAIPHAPAPIDLHGTWDVLVHGVDEQDEMGIALASGDWNGDGMDDLAIGAWLADSFENDRPNAGEVYLLFGEKIAHRTGASTRPFADLVYGARAGDRWGTAFASGDWDADGIADLAIAARFAGSGEDTVPRRAGQIAILYGGAAPESARQITNLEREADLVVFGADEGDHLGRGLLLADLDGDGLDDLVIAAVDADGTKNAVRDCGEIYCVWGERRTEPQTKVDLFDFNGWSIAGVDPNDGVGRNLATGDFDGDGWLDLALSASFADGAENARTNAGDTYVLFGGSREDLSARRELARHSDCVLFGSAAYENCGVSLAAGDLDGDGLADLAIGANLADEPKETRDMCGAVYVMRGRERGAWKRRADLGRDADLTFVGARESEQIGLTLATLAWGDDAIADLAVGANLATAGTPPRERAGRVFILSGAPGFFDEARAPRVLETAATRIIDGAGPKDQSAFALGRIARAEGNDRLLVGAPFADGPRDERPDGGEVYILSGGRLMSSPPAP